MAVSDHSIALAAAAAVSGGAALHMDLVVAMAARAFRAGLEAAQALLAIEEAEQASLQLAAGMIVLRIALPRGFLYKTRSSVVISASKAYKALSRCRVPGVDGIIGKPLNNAHGVFLMLVVFSATGRGPQFVAG